MTKLFPPLTADVEKLANFLNHSADKFGPISPTRHLPSSRPSTDASAPSSPPSQDPSSRQVHGRYSSQAFLVQPSAKDKGLERVLSEHTIECCRRRLAELLGSAAEPVSTGSSVHEKNFSKNSIARSEKGADVSNKSPSIPLRLQIMSRAPPEIERTKRDSVKRGVKRPTEQCDVESSPDGASTLKRRRRTSRSASVSQQRSRFQDMLHIPRHKSKESGRSFSSRRRSTNSKDMDHDAHISSQGVPSMQVPRSMQAPDSSGSSAKNLSPRKKPLERILDFARGKTSQLAKLDVSDEDDRLRRRTSLAAFLGCGELSDVSLAAYLRVLCTFHAKVVEAAASDNPSEPKVLNIDVMSCESSDEEVSRAISSDGATRKDQTNVRPPHIESTIDVLQLVFRLWQKMFLGDESVTCRFLDCLYAEKAITAISSLSISVLKLWQARNEVAKESAHARSELLEWSVRLLANIINFELSPVSRILDVKSARSPLLFIDYVAEKSNTSLPQVLNIILEYVGSESTTGRECRQAATDIFQVYLIRHHRHFQKGNPQEGAWKITVDSGDGHIEHVIQHKTFWPLTVTFAIQTVKKNQQQVDVWVAIAFLVSVLCEPVASRNLLETQTKARHALFEVLLRLLDRVGRDILSFVAEIESTENLYPGLPSALDLIRKLMSFAIVQRELISSRKLGRKEDYLEAIENIISRAAKLVEGPVDSAKLMAFAHKDGCGKLADELQKSLENHTGEQQALGAETDSELEDPEAIRLNAIARYRALAFAAWLIGSLGKSMEDGSRDMSQMNGLHVLVASKFIGTRKLGKLWTDVMKIQFSLEHRIPTDLRGPLPRSSEALLSELERNYFSIVVEGVRSKLVAETKSKEGRSSPDNLSKQSSPEADVMAVSRSMNANIWSFPDVTKIKPLRSVVCSAKGYQDLDDDPNILDHVIRTFKSESEETLARYDPESKLSAPWVRLNRRNAYIEGAREFLDKEDKVLGHLCSCLPGNPTESNNGSQNRIACSNDSCENRLTKVECVPGECGAGSYCQNQRMQRLEYAKTKTVIFPNKGVGVVANEDVPAGAFIGEYQGEVISNETFNKRKKEYRGERHFYFMTLTSKLVIDASRKSQFTRYVNHSCEPNSETQKWNAGGEPRVGIYATRDISKGEEITFDYGARSLANDAVPCLCGAKTCRGFLTTKKTQEGDPDNVPVDVSGLANAADPTQDNGNQSKQEREEELNTTEEDEKFQEELATRIEKAKKKLALVQDLTVHKAEALKSQSVFDELALSDKMRLILSDWESSVRRMQKAKSLIKENPPAKSETRIRIPRRPPQPQSATQQSFLKSFIEQRKPKEGGLKVVTKPKSNKPLLTKPEVLKSEICGERVKSSLPRERPSAPKRNDAQPGMLDTTPRRPASTRKIMPFMPTSTKFKRPLLKPIIVKKAKRKTSTDDTDSMDGYSTASSVEPIMDESDFDEAPDGGFGARSDDEFVVAPPVEAEHRESMQRDGRVPHERRQNFHAARSRNGVLTENRYPRESHSRWNRRENERRRLPTDMQKALEYYGGRDNRGTNIRIPHNESHRGYVGHHSIAGQGGRKHDLCESHSPRFQGNQEGRPREATLLPLRVGTNRYRYGMEGLPGEKMRPRQEPLNDAHREPSPGGGKYRGSRPFPAEVDQSDSDYQHASVQGRDRNFHRDPPLGAESKRDPHRAYAPSLRGTRDTYRPPITNLDRSKDFHRTSPAVLDRSRGSLCGPALDAGRSRESEQSSALRFGEIRKLRGSPMHGLDGSQMSPSRTYRKADTHRRGSPSGIQRSRNIDHGPLSSLDKDEQEGRSWHTHTLERDQPYPERDLEKDHRARDDRPSRAMPEPFNPVWGRDSRLEEDKGRWRKPYEENQSWKDLEIPNRRGYRANNEEYSLRGHKSNMTRKEEAPPRLSDQDWRPVAKADGGDIHQEAEILKKEQQSSHPLQRGRSEVGRSDNEGTRRNNMDDNSYFLKGDSSAQRELVHQEMSSGSTLKQSVTGGEHERNADGTSQKAGTNAFISEKDESIKKSSETELAERGKMDLDRGALEKLREGTAQDAAKGVEESADKRVVGGEGNILTAKDNNGKAPTEPLRRDETNDRTKAAKMETREHGINASKNEGVGLSSSATRVELSKADGQDKKNEVARKGVISRIELPGNGLRGGPDRSGIGGSDVKSVAEIEKRSDVGVNLGKRMARYSPKSTGTHTSRFRRVGPEMGGTKRSRSEAGLDENKRMKRYSGSVDGESYLGSGKDGKAETVGELRVEREERNVREGIMGERGKNVLDRMGQKASAKVLGLHVRDSNGMYRNSSGPMPRRPGEGMGGRRKRSRGGGDKSPTRDNGRMQKGEHGARRSEGRVEFDERQTLTSGGNVHQSQHGAHGDGQEKPKDLRSLLMKRK